VKYWDVGDAGAIALPHSSQDQVGTIDDDSLGASLMNCYSLQQLTEELHHLLAQVDQSPVVLTEAAEPRYILLSVENYRQLLRSFQILEDQMWGESAKKAIQDSEMVKSEEFVAALQQILALEIANEH
jgi:PHD/YefM family antitoxin component YafN of YafNO toxin-antitoxin module